MDGKNNPLIGILALQGAFKEHRQILTKLNCKTMLVRKGKQLNNLDGLIIPGGESTTIGKLMIEYNIVETIKEKANKGLIIFGTCAGMILLASEVSDNNIPNLGLINISVVRNAFGRQIDSFEKDLAIPELGNKSFPAVFIRAPFIIKSGMNVKIMASCKGKTVMARNKNILVSSFHPELTDDFRVHQYFIDMI